MACARPAAFALPLALAGCAGLLGPRYEVPAGPRSLDESTPWERLEYMRRARVWRPVAIASLDLLTGPPGDDGFTFDQQVRCDYSVDHTERLAGKTPKFGCTLTPGDTVKVKYGPDNPEVYAEVVGTRLLWALGFGADRIYAVRVVCRGCPPDPWGDRQPDMGAERTFDPATIERAVEGDEIEVKGAAKGWAWWEPRLLEERVGGSPRAHVDAFRLLAAFLQHGDNKDEQQRFVCLPGGVARRPDGSETCTRPFLFVTDLGGILGRSALLKRSKMRFAHWSAVPVWKEPEECVAKLKRSVKSTMGDPRISEAGRAFLAGLLTQLSDRQIRDLFIAARVEHLDEQLEGPDGRRRPVTADDWTEAFKRKRDEVVRLRCPQ